MVSDLSGSRPGRDDGVVRMDWDFRFALPPSNRSRHPRVGGDPFNFQAWTDPGLRRDDVRDTGSARYPHSRGWPPLQP